MLLAIGVLTFVSTFIGGLFALRFRDKLHLLLGFSAGAVVGVAFFDILPEALDQGLGSGNAYLSSPHAILLLVAVGFLLYMSINRSLGHAHDDEETHAHKASIGAGSLSLHSMLDGLGIGLAFQVSAAVGLIVAVGVLVHDFSDGINTVNMVLRAGGSKHRALRWLSLDALSPLLGILISLFIRPSAAILALLLALFAGFFLYIGASDLLPESHHQHPTHWTTLTTILGALVIYAAVTFAGI